MNRGFKGSPNAEESGSMGSYRQGKRNGSEMVSASEIADFV